MTWYPAFTPVTGPGQVPVPGFAPACDRCVHAWWNGIGEPAPIYPSREHGARWLAEIYGWYTTGRLLCPPCAAAWCAALGHRWHFCPPLRLGGQLIDLAVRYCDRCGDWTHLHGPDPTREAVPLTAVERQVLTELEQQLTGTTGPAGGGIR